MKIKSNEHLTKARKAARHRRARHESTPTLTPDGDGASMPDQPFAEGAADEINADLRHRLVSETAFHHLADRGYVAGNEVDDWVEAEAQVDHVLINRAPDGKDRSGAD